MKKITIVDTTLQEIVSQGENAVGFKEKIEIAKALDKIRVDTIELPCSAEEKVNELLIKTIAPLLRQSRLSCQGGHTEAEISRVWDAMKTTKKPVIRIAMPVSAIRMEYVLNKKPTQVLELITQLVSFAKNLTQEVDFVAEDATGAEWDFLCKAVASAVRAGATMVTVSDSSGMLLPDEFASFVGKLKSAVPELSSVEFVVSFANTLKMAEAASIAAVSMGANGIKVSTAGKAAAGLQAVADLFAHRGDALGVSISVSQTQMQQTVNRIAQIAYGTKLPAEETKDMGRTADTDVLILKEGDSIQTVTRAAKELGYDLSPEEKKKVYEAFCGLVQKKEIGAKELEAIIANEAMQVPPTYKLKSYVINNGNLIRATAHIILEKQNGKIATVEGFCVGDGPIEAAFLAIEQIVGRKFELDEFQIQAVTEGREAMGDTLVKIRANGKLYSGKGISTDIIGASISAYISAVNKIVFEENVK